MPNRKTCFCIQCRAEVSTSNISKHFRSKPCLAGGKSTGTLTHCPHCTIPAAEIKTNFANHVKWCNPTVRQRIQIHSAISTAKRKANTDYASIGRSISALYKAGVYDHAMQRRKQNPTFKGKQHTNETKEKIRAAALASGHQRVMRKTHEFVCKRGRAFKFDSTWEDALAIRLDELDIAWSRPGPILYLLHGISKNYFPDFYLPEHDVYLDPKNLYVQQLQQEKLSIVSKQINLIILSTLLECKQFTI